MSEQSEKLKILVTHPATPQAAIDLLSHDYEVIFCQSVPPIRSEILEKCKGVDAVLWASHLPLDKGILDAIGPQLKVVSTRFGGTDFVDVEEFKRRKIPLGYTPCVQNDAVANMAVGLLLAAARRFHEGRLKIETNNWETYTQNWMLGQDFRNSVVGFYGFGGIAQTIAKRLSGFDIDSVLYTTRSRVSEEIEKEYNAKKVDFDTMLAQSDFIIIAAPLTKETAGVFNATAFGKMKKTAVLVNIARGGVVNQQDLYEALKTNQIFAAGLDVMTPEPLPPNDPLLSLPNIVLMPHLGSATKRTREDLAVLAAKNILHGLTGKPMPAPAY
ncbi:glyoxylate reductase/hydroxypyruvate reductase [Bactrocera dorsalis]|uniref:Glyoxylate reductase/hydroxypyruvate reductase n=1 Tax=Bactrocera dorsalis TaxID=27457 RepID=A0ABM3IZY1_BACDO|nr:glyoxylate reductase/hydroxypyruvate reductase [Bactrocera dorsalis]XP_049302526.1 glyoxylate reductase/hydroxypyruvate reductase [Bactrocera dorsalis]XP_049302527.1 glyoxylate reductase/hydroxypyruvate reductase [Bactrocera dorsalis]XP_049302528.1 glyoxylate reductase/hydroxypyruvate reductase [Bactrocera dorsalis]XP_049302529.1 glyoxylate reductase/hydroxypyruvate reductase [Bactrocera dorsalis]XP_049302530.1 glyoxylate reductase/hydroxypyruvate reductase [Bactrocera dorsalis]